MWLANDRVDVAPRTEVLPAGQANVLCPVVQGPGGRPRGEFSFRGRGLSIETDGTDDVLFPTDVGLSLLTALCDASDVDVKGARALDVGCGSGVYTVALLAAGAAEVTALDINPRAVSVTAENVRRNGLDPARVDQVCADLAELDVRQAWDVVVCNPPHLPQDLAYAACDGTGMALVGGPTGRALYDLLLGRLDDLLAPGGVLILAHSSLADIPKTLAMLSGSFTTRTLGICQLDIPLRRYAAHRDVLLSRLYRLRARKQAMFTGLRFEVHTLAVTRAVRSVREEVWHG